LNAALDLAQMQTPVRLGHQKGQYPAAHGGSTDDQLGRGTVLTHANARSHTWNKRTHNGEQVNMRPKRPGRAPGKP
jgi:hypothetical protein